MVEMHVSLMVECTHDYVQIYFQIVYPIYCDVIGREVR